MLNNFVFFCKQKTAYEMRISDWSSDVCSSDLNFPGLGVGDAEIEHARLAVGDGIQRLGDHSALDAAAGDRADELAVVINGKLAADGPWCRAPGGNRKSTRLNSSH